MKTDSKLQQDEMAEPEQCAAPTSAQHLVGVGGRTESHRTTRRRFIEVMPLAGVALLAACGEKKAASPEPAAPVPDAVPAPVVTPAAPQAPAATSEPAAAPVAAGPLLDEKSEKAVKLGYVSDAKRADAALYKTYAGGQACSNCALFQGNASDASAPCPLFAGNSVAAQGWCSAYSKKTT